MARTAITPLAKTSGYAAAMSTLTLAVADVANGNSVVMSGSDLLMVRNDHATVAKTLTITGAADPFGRTVTIVESVAAGVTKFLGPLPKLGWVQPTGATDAGSLRLDGESTDVKIAVIAM